MRWKLTPLPVITGLISLSVLYGHLLIPGRALADRDIPGLHLPMLTNLVRLAKQGFPYWNPWIHGGQPLVANPHYATFYPPTWVALLVPVYYAIGLLVVLHATWAFVGAWKLAIRWGCSATSATLAGVAFVGGSAFCWSTDLLNLYMGLSWIPWVLYWGTDALGRDSSKSWYSSGVKTALALAAQILVGSPVTPLLSLLALACLGLEGSPIHWRRVARLVPIGSVSLALAAIQLIPTVRHVSASTRGSGMAEEMALTWSSPPIRLAEWFWPRIFGDPMQHDFHLYAGYPGLAQPVPLILSIYCGALVIALALGGLADRDLPYRRTLVAMILIGVFLAMGRYNPVYSAVLIKLPPFSVIRFPEKFLLLSTTGIAFSAALAWQRLLEIREQSEVLPRSKASLIVSILVLSSCVILYFIPLIAPDLTLDLLEGSTAERLDLYEEPGGHSDLMAQTLAARAGRLGRETFVTVLFWLGALLVLLLHAKRSISRSILVSLVLGLSILDLAYYSRPVNKTVPASLLQNPPEQLAEFPPSAGRVFSDGILFGNKEFMIPDPESEIPSSLRRFLQRLDPYTANIWGYAYALEPDPDLMVSPWAYHALNLLDSESGLRTEGWSERAYRYLGTWNIGTIVRRRSPEAQMEEMRRTGLQPEPVRLQRNPYVLSRIRFLSEGVFAPNLAQAVDLVSDRDFQVASFDAIVDPVRSSSAPTSAFDSRVQVIEVKDSGSTLEIQYQVDRTAFMVAAITADRDWRAYVDGVSTPIYVTALGQMGVELPAGRHRLTLKYRNRAVGLGAVLTLLSIIGCATVLLPRRILDRD